MLVSIAGMVVVIDEDLIQTQTVECLTIYDICENKLLYMYYTTTILCSPLNIDIVIYANNIHMNWVASRTDIIMYANGTSMT